MICCDNCSDPIEIDSPRYKHKNRKNYDICRNCLIALGENPSNFFHLENKVDEMLFHDWFKCKKISYFLLFLKTSFHF